MTLKITKNTIKRDSKYKPKSKKIKVHKKSKYVTGTPFEQHFGFRDLDRPVEEYMGGGLESVGIPKLKESLKEY